MSAVNSELLVVLSNEVNRVEVLKDFSLTSNLRVTLFTSKVLLNGIYISWKIASHLLTQKSSGLNVN